MNKYVFLGIVGILVCIFIGFFIYKFAVENFFSDDQQNYNNKDDTTMRKNMDVDMLENNTYLSQDYNNVVNSDNILEFQYKGPTWKNEFDYNNSEFIKANYKRDKLLEHIRYLSQNDNYKTYQNINNTTFCGGRANKCVTANDCCGGFDCINGICLRE